MLRFVVSGIAVLTMATLVAGCGGGSGGVLGETASNLAKVKSGVLDLRLTAAAGERQTGEEAGLRLQGPFAEASAKGRLPTADITYTRFEGRAEEKVRLVTSGNKAFVVRGGRTTQLSEAETKDLEVSGGSGVDLHLDKWFDHPKITDAGVVDGVRAQRITGRLDAAAAMNDLFKVSQNFGAADVKAPEIKGQLADRLKASTQSATAEVITGKADHMLRNVVVDIILTSQAPSEIRDALGRLSAVRFHFALGLSQPNRPIHVTAPEA